MNSIDCRARTIKQDPFSAQTQSQQFLEQICHKCLAAKDLRDLFSINSILEPNYIEFLHDVEKATIVNFLQETLKKLHVELTDYQLRESNDNKLRIPWKNINDLIKKYAAIPDFDIDISPSPPDFIIDTPFWKALDPEDQNNLRTRHSDCSAEELGQSSIFFKPYRSERNYFAFHLYAKRNGSLTFYQRLIDYIKKDLFDFGQLLSIFESLPPKELNGELADLIYKHLHNSSEFAELHKQLSSMFLERPPGKLEMIYSWLILRSNCPYSKLNRAEKVYYLVKRGLADIRELLPLRDEILKAQFSLPEKLTLPYKHIFEFFNCLLYYQDPAWVNKAGRNIFFYASGGVLGLPYGDKKVYQALDHAGQNCVDFRLSAMEEMMGKILEKGSIGEEQSNVHLQEILQLFHDIKILMAKGIKPSKPGYNMRFSFESEPIPTHSERWFGFILSFLANPKYKILASYVIESLERDQLERILEFFYFKNEEFRFLLPYLIQASENSPSVQTTILDCLDMALPNPDLESASAKAIVLLLASCFIADPSYISLRQYCGAEAALLLTGYEKGFLEWSLYSHSMQAFVTDAYFAAKPGFLCRSISGAVDDMAAYYENFHPDARLYIEGIYHQTVPFSLPHILKKIPLHIMGTLQKQDFEVIKGGNFHLSSLLLKLVAQRDSFDRSLVSLADLMECFDRFSEEETEGFLKHLFRHEEMMRLFARLYLTDIRLNIAPLGGLMSSYAAFCVPLLTTLSKKARRLAFSHSDIKTTYSKPAIPKFRKDFRLRGQLIGVLGRTVLIKQTKTRKIHALKFCRANENLTNFCMEARVTRIYRNFREKHGGFFKSDFHKPVGLYALKDMPRISESMQIPEMPKKNCYYIYHYKADPLYFTYLHESDSEKISYADYQHARLAFLHDTAKQIYKGILPDIAPLFHNTGQNRTYFPLPEIVTLQKAVHKTGGSGRLDKGHFGIEYINARGNGLADLADAELIDQLSKEKKTLKKFENDLNADNFGGGHLSILLMALGRAMLIDMLQYSYRQLKLGNIDFLNEEANEEHGIELARGIGILMSSYTNLPQEQCEIFMYYCGVNWQRAAAQMSFWMQNNEKGYLPYMREGLIPEGLFDSSMHVKVNAQAAQNFDPRIGFSADKQNPDFGPYNGPMAMPEIEKAWAIACLMMIGLA